MKKQILIILILSVCSTNLFSTNIGSKLDINILYHPSITLDDRDDLPIYSSIASIYDFTPVYLKLDNHKFGAYFSILHVSPSLVYNSEFLREFSAVGLGLNYAYFFSEKFSLDTKLSMGVGKLGPSQNQELYSLLSIAPSYILNKGETYEIAITVPINLIYRKYLLSPTVGIGLSTSFNWLTQLFYKVQASK